MVDLVLQAEAAHMAAALVVVQVVLAVTQAAAIHYMQAVAQPAALD
jgi:hypothetical protein